MLAEQPQNQVMPPPAASTRRGERIGLALLVAAMAVLLVAGLRNLTAPWELGMRGVTAALYSDGAVAHTLAYGLGVTLGMPAFIVEDNGELIRNVNWHHPPLYWLYLSLAAWLFGHETWVLRLAQLCLFVPGLLALYVLTRRLVGPVIAGVVALLFATCPMVAYFGPMVVQDGAVLGIGLVTLWSFLRHVSNPTWRSWWATAGWFFLVTSLDFPGYWWGLAMFTLALGVEHRGRAVLAVFSLFPVSVFSLAVLSVHYGLVLGGPLRLVYELLHVLGTEGSHVADAARSARMSTAIDDVLYRTGNWPFLGLAVLGFVLAIVVRTSTVWRLAWLGLALAVPGILNVGLMFSHALDHVFWSMHGFAGPAAWAAIVPLTGVRWLRAGGALALAGAALVATTVVTGVWGCAMANELVVRHEFVDNGTPAMIKRALPHLRGCATTLTSAPAVPQVYFGHTSIVTNIETPEVLQALLELGRQAKARGMIGFVVDPKHRNSPLTALLDTLATPVAVDDLLVYRLTQ